MKIISQIFRYFLFVLFFMHYTNASVSTPINLDMNSTVSAAITSTSEVSPNSSKASEYFTFTLTEKKNILISLEAHFQNTLYLLDINGSIIKRISNLEYLNQNIVITLPIGTYTIDVSIVVPDEYGSFSLALKENIIDIESITIDTILDGEWTSNSGISPNSLYATKYYTFTLNERTNVLLDLEGNSPYMYLLDSNGSVIESSTSTEYNRAKIVKTLEAGSYMVDVTKSMHMDYFGTYTLRFKSNIISTTEIGLNSTVEDSWSISSGVSPRSKQYANYYTFTLDEDKDIVIGFETDLFSQKLYLLDDNKSVVAESYGKKVIVKHLLAGTYTIDATSTHTTTGTYSLFLKENIILNTPIDINSSVFSTLNTSSGISHENGGYSNYYTFTVDEEQDIIIGLLGANTVLYLLDENGNRDYSVSTFNNKIVRTFTAGIYTIEVTQWTREEQDFQLSIQENRLITEEIAFDTFVSGTLTQGDGLSENTHNAAKEYTFNLLKEMDVVIELNTSITNSRVFLKDDKGMIRSLHRERGLYSLEAGNYALEVTYEGRDENITGVFTLNIKENIIKKKPIVFNVLTQGEWSQNSAISTYGSYVNEYTFSLTEETEVLFVLQSDYSKYLFIDGYSVYSHNSNSVAFFKMLGAGTHTVSIVIDEWSNLYQTGDYTLLIQADIEQPLSVSALTTHEVHAYSANISWKQGSDSTVGYKIYLNGIKIADIDASNNSYTIGGLTPESEHGYSVVAYNSAGESETVNGSFRTKKDDYAWLVPVQYIILN